MSSHSRVLKEQDDDCLEGSSDRKEVVEEGPSTSGGLNSSEAMNSSACTTARPGGEDRISP
jgi:hypothetical protein